MNCENGNWNLLPSSVLSLADVAHVLQLFPLIYEAALQTVEPSLSYPTLYPTPPQDRKLVEESKRLKDDGTEQGQEEAKKQAKKQAQEEESQEEKSQEEKSQGEKSQPDFLPPYVPP